MRQFSYYLFENFDADAEAENPQNPRRFLNESADPLLSHVASFPAGKCPATDPDPRFLEGGILRIENNALLFETPVFLQEDAPILHHAMHRKATRLVQLLTPTLPKLRQCCARLNNGFPAEENLYHILCGMVFDGLFFDFLQQNNALATSRPHPTGLNYLSVIYEDCPELDTLSNHLLCSYNRFTDGHTALQSFGDANGDRLDFYRFSRLLESGKLPASFDHLAPALRRGKNHILSETRAFQKIGTCDPDTLSLLTTFGYVKNGQICVPVYTSAADEIAAEAERIVEETIGQAFLDALSDLPDITAARHGVPPKEIANELYHILFGTVNEALTASGAVASPPHIPGQGRFLRCILLDS